MNTVEKNTAKKQVKSKREVKKITTGFVITESKKGKKYMQGSLPAGRVIFCSLITSAPSKMAHASNDLYWNITLAIPKKDILVKKVIKEVREFGAEYFAKIEYEDVKIPLRDGDAMNDNSENHNPLYENCYIIFLKVKQREEDLDCLTDYINVFDSENIEIGSEQLNMFYNGCYVQAVVTFATYSFGANDGVCCYLNALKYLSDGEPIEFDRSKQNAKKFTAKVDEQGAIAY